MAVVVPFPLERRCGFVQRLAARAASLTSDGGQRYLRQQLRVQADSLMRKGVDYGAVDREIRALETAIRNECCRLLAAKTAGSQ